MACQVGNANRMMQQYGLYPPAGEVGP